MPLNNAHFRGFFFYNMTQIILYYTIYHKNQNNFILLKNN